MSTYTSIRELAAAYPAAIQTPSPPPEGGETEKGQTTMPKAVAPIIAERGVRELEALAESHDTTLASALTFALLGAEAAGEARGAAAVLAEIKRQEP